MTVHQAAGTAKAKSRVHRPQRIYGVIAGYINAHSRVAKLRGKAVQHVCVDCEASFADQWSYDGNAAHEQTERRPVYRRADGTFQYALVAFSSNAMDYSPRCRECHKQYDVSARKARAS